MRVNATVHNIRKEAMTEDDVYIGRAGQGKDGYFGNPYHRRLGMTKADSLRAFFVYATNRIHRDPQYREAVAGLHGKRIFCFCSPERCHGHILSFLAQRLVEGHVIPKPNSL